MSSAHAAFRGVTASGVVRAGTIADLDFITASNIAIAIETENLVLNPDTVRAGCAAVLTDESKGRYFVLEVDGQPASQLMITYEWSDWRNSNMWWIQSVYVIPTHRRRGLFTELFGAVREAATAEGVEVMRLYADNTNKRAHAAYVKLGMATHYACFEIDLSKST